MKSFLILFSITGIRPRRFAARVYAKLSFAALTLTWTGDHFQGEWRQGPAPLAFELEQVADFPTKPRP
ncbi:MAG: hypothetical protein JWR65_3303, partial [Massilia sp.]|nr:hypothetical protein [Massilia sp.]